MRIPACITLLTVALSYASEGLAEQVSASKSRVVVLTDMGNEPDDQMSFTRLLMYTNEIDVEAVVATTSTWLKDKTNPQTIHKLIDAYGKTRPNLLLHAQGWPAADALHSAVHSGHTAYGMDGITDKPLSDGAKALIAAADKPDQRPLWVSVWGGANTLAEALQQVKKFRSAQQLSDFVSKLRVYSISDQDDAGPWIREHFPNLFYVVKPSSPDGEEYRSATWTGIGGEEFYRNGKGADFTTVSNEWLEKNIRAYGPLGALYPEYDFIMEGDTPAFLGLIRNGLNSHESPSWGGWSGRYVYRQPYGETRPIWTQGGDAFFRMTSQDAVVGMDGDTYVSDHATIWRWREQFQHDFSARIQWTVKDYASANHHPTLVVNGDRSKDTIFIKAKAGDTIELDARGSQDPDGDKLRYQWFAYPEAGAGVDVLLSDVQVKPTNKAKTKVTINTVCRDGWFHFDRKCEQGIAHVILAVTDNGKPALTSYRRVVFETTPGE